jgi:SNF2 family DNA or RNA helicase
MTRRNRLRRLCVSPDLLFHKKDAPAHVTQTTFPSSKIGRILEYLETRVLPGEKVIVYHEWKSVLDYLAAWLKLRNISYAMMVGPTPVYERRSIIDRVKSTSEHPRVVLMTLKLGAHGLDGLQGFTAPDSPHPAGGANHVLFISGYWTPTTEYQAISRLTRPGQGRTVHAYKFAFRHSVETTMHNIHQKKVVAGDAIMSQLALSKTRINVEELRD